MSQQNLNIARNSFGQLVFTDPDGKAHLVTPVRAFPIAAPAENIGLINTEGEEVAWIERLSDLPDDSRQLIADEIMNHGTVDHAPVYPREVMRRALELSASAVILVHNHPSGDQTPSTADIEMTRKVVDGGRTLGIAVHDHVVVGRVDVASFKALGLM